METYSGLSPDQVVLQSRLCHPDWDAHTHAEYLVIEEGLDPGFVETLPIRHWLGETP